MVDNVQLMKELILQFPQQLKAEFLHDNKHTFKSGRKEVQNICVAGMGGSGIGGDYVKQFIRDHCSVPFYSVKTDSIPAFVNEQTLFITSSYSGNTAETLSCLHQAMDKNAQIVCLTSGGEMMEIAKSRGLELINIPPGLPIPRASLGYSIMAQLKVICGSNLVDNRIFEKVSNCSAMLQNSIAEINQTASNIADIISKTIPVCYAGDQFGPVLLRFRQQVNENAKSLCGHKLLPEMNHNEIVGWTNSTSGLTVVFFRGTSERKQTTKRLNLTTSLLRNKVDAMTEILAVGDDLIEQSIYLTYLSDWVSYFLAKRNGVDPIEIQMIDKIKSAL